MKSPLKIILICFISLFSCKKDTNGIISDKDFTVCSELKYNKAIEYGPAIGAMVDKKNIHSLLEAFLIEQRYLKAISKKDYALLFDKIRDGKIESDFIYKFKKKLGFDPYLLFPIMTRMQCYDLITIREKLQGIEIDKTNWQYQLREVYWKIEVYGNPNFEDSNLKNLLNKIPEDKFQLIIYRKLFLDIIYYYIDKNTVGNKV